MREVLGAGRGVQEAGEVEMYAYRRWQQRREERRGKEQRAMRRATGHKIASAYGYATQHAKPQGFIIRPPLLTTNNFLNCRYRGVLFI